jgi:hypothetical protein
LGNGGTINLGGTTSTVTWTTTSMESTDESCSTSSNVTVYKCNGTGDYGKYDGLLAGSQLSTTAMATQSNWLSGWFITSRRYKNKGAANEQVTVVWTYYQYGKATSTSYSRTDYTKQ